MNQDQALRGAEQRISALLLARTDPPLAGVPIPDPQVPAFLLADNPTSRRVCRAVTLSIPPGVDAFALFTEDWRRAGFAPRSLSSPDGPVLVGQDPVGFVFVLQHRAGQVELSVVSPLLMSTRGAFVGGIILGAMLGFVGPCFSEIALMRSFGERHAFLAFVPVVLLLGGGLLVSPSTRKFGLGLLIGGAAVGVVTAGICAQMLSA